MNKCLNFFLAADKEEVHIQLPVHDVRKRLLATYSKSFDGEVKDTGFVLRRIAEHPKDTRSAVHTQGKFQEDHGTTKVIVSLRHGSHMVLFGWLLAFLACGIGTYSIITANKSALTGGAIIAGLALIWMIRLNRNVSSVKQEIRQTMCE